MLAFRFSVNCSRFSVHGLSHFTLVLFEFICHTGIFSHSFPTHSASFPIQHSINSPPIFLCLLLVTPVCVGYFPSSRSIFASLYSSHVLQFVLPHFRSYQAVILFLRSCSTLSNVITASALVHPRFWRSENESIIVNTCVSPMILS